jgi:hypothetical protein
MYSARNLPTFQRHQLFYYEVKGSKYFGYVGIYQNQERHTQLKVQEGAAFK